MHCLDLHIGIYLYTFISRESEIVDLLKIDEIALSAFHG